MGAKRLASEIAVQPRNYHTHASVGKTHTQIDNAAIEELRLVKSHNLHIIGYHCLSVIRISHRSASNLVASVRHNIIGRKPYIQRRLNSHDLLPGYPGPFYSFGLTLLSFR